jgi:hypothetical protein
MKYTQEKNFIQLIYSEKTPGSGAGGEFINGE